MSTEKDRSTSLFNGTRLPGFGYQLVPEFHVSQAPERRQVLDLIRQRLGCGRIRENHRGSADTTLVYVVRNREDLMTRVIPFFEAQPLLSSKQKEFATFAAIVQAMARGEHRSADGFETLKRIALSMNGGGRYRRVHRWKDPESSETICRTPADPGEDMVRSAWRHAESGRNDLAPENGQGSARR